MITYEQVDELSGQTSLPLIEIIRALHDSGGDSDAARAVLTGNDSSRIDIHDRELARMLATTLIEDGTHFVCETTGQEEWLFRMSPESATRVCTVGPLAWRHAPPESLPALAEPRRAVA
jgi:hypothetical protein